MPMARHQSATQGTRRTTSFGGTTIGGVRGRVCFLDRFHWGAITFAANNHQNRINAEGKGMGICRSPARAC